MAQYFYDLSIANPNEYPALLKGGNSTGTLANHILSPVKSNLIKGLFVSSPSTNFSRISMADVSDADVDVVYRVTGTITAASSSFANSGHAVFARAAGSIGSLFVDDCYYLSLNGNTTLASNNRSIYLYSVVSGTQTQLASMTNAVTASSGGDALDTAILMRMQCVGTTIRGKAWLETEPEPATWQVSITNSDHASGKVGVKFPAYGMKFIASELRVGTDSDMAPTSFPGGNRIVAGTLLKPDSSPAEGYMVRCYHRETGVLLGETLANVIGAFSFSLPIPTSEKVYCVGVDQLGNTWNAPIKDLISPVAP